MVEFKDNLNVVIPFKNKEIEILDVVMAGIREELENCTIILSDVGSVQSIRDGAKKLAEKHKSIYLGWKPKGLWSKTYSVNVGYRWQYDNIKTEWVGLFDADNLTGVGFGEWAKSALDHTPVVTMRALRCGKKAARWGKLSDAAVKERFGPAPTDITKRKDWMIPMVAAQFEGDDLDKAIGCCSYNLIMKNETFMAIRGQDETMFGYWHDQPDLCEVLEVNGFPIQVCPRRHMGFHFNHDGQRPKIFPACTAKRHSRRARMEKGEKVLANETIEGDAWGRGILLDQLNCTGV